MSLYVATIELETPDDYLLVSDPGDYGEEGCELDVSPTNAYSTGFTLRTQSGAFEVGGRATGQNIPIRELTLPFNLSETDDQTIEETISRFRRLWGSPPNLNKVTWRYTTEISGPRTLQLRLQREIGFSPAKDWNLQGFARAVVSAVALNPMYEGPEIRATWENPTTGTNWGWFPCWNPTDQPLWLEWVFDPADEWRYADFSFGQERKQKRPAGADAARMIVTPELVSELSVMADPMMRTYVSADGSNITPLFNGVEPVYMVPPYTGTEADPILLPVMCTGPSGAKATLVQRRFWSAEAGLEA